MQKEIQLTDKTLLVVSVPSLAIEIEVIEKRLFYCENKNNINEEITAVYIGDGYELLGIYPELTEEQARQVVKSRLNAIYFNYVKDRYDDLFYKAKESFQSLMERENITGYDKYAILIKSK